MNPYEPSQVRELTSSQKPIPQFIPKPQLGIGRIVLREWLARLWIYNGVLAIVFFSTWASDNVSWQDFDHGMPFFYLNVGYFLGPLLEWGISKQRNRRVDWGIAIFVAILAIGYFAMLIFIVLANMRGFGLG
jgi:hypothetical protein